MANQKKFTGLMEGVAGVRGIIGGGLTPQVVSKYAAAYGSMIGQGEVVVGMDGRPSGSMVMDAVSAGLRSVGCNVLDIGKATTPTIQILIGQRGSQGGIAITASHNPQMWNALKFFSTSSLFLDETEGKALRDILYNDKIEFVSWDRLGGKSKYKEAVNDHIKAVLRIPYLDLAVIRRRGFKVAVDCVNASGSLLLPELFKELGCTVFKINCEPTGIFPREAEPLPENLTDLSNLVKETGADIGFAIDPDGDRLAVIDENGNPIGEENTLVLASDFVLSHQKGPIVANVSTTRAMDDLAEKYGVDLHRTLVGEVHVAKKMAVVGAVIGGEGNGGVILPDIHLGRDAPVGAALILQYLTEKDRSVSGLLSELPKYEIVKDRIEIEGLDKNEVLDAIAKQVTDGKLDKTDGLKFIYPKSWVQVRASNTEPILRIFAEAETRELALKHCKVLMDIINKMKK